MQFERDLRMRREREDVLYSELRVAVEQARRSAAEAAQRPSSAPSSAPEISGRVGSPRGLGSMVTHLLGVGKPDFQVQTPEPPLMGFRSNDYLDHAVRCSIDTEEDVEGHEVVRVGRFASTSCNGGYCCGVSDSTTPGDAEQNVCRRTARVRR